jgi:hypothetical protein
MKIMEILHIVSELACPDIRMDIKDIRWLGSFVNLERLAFQTIHFNDSCVVDALLAMPRLTHISISDYHLEGSGYLGGLSRMLASPVFQYLLWELCTGRELIRITHAKVVFLNYGERLWFSIESSTGLFGNCGSKG